MMGLVTKLTNPYAILALAVGTTFGLWQWSKHDLKKAQAQIEAADAMIAVATKQVEEAKALNEGNQAAFDAMTREIERQKSLAAKFQSEARKRNAAYVNLQKEIANVPNRDDVPVPDAIEHVLDSLRLAGPGGRGDAPAHGADPGQGSGEAGVGGPEVPGDATAPGETGDGEHPIKTGGDVPR